MPSLGQTVMATSDSAGVEAQIVERKRSRVSGPECLPAEERDELFHASTAHQPGGVGSSDRESPRATAIGDVTDISCTTNVDQECHEMSIGSNTPNH